MTLFGGKGAVLDFLHSDRSRMCLFPLEGVRSSRILGLIKFK
uniref:Uncharacterized protein n=1 Tax=Ascaris lumbricoides TaxID=6252 RepID=A0A0M3IMS6_ASCLU